MAGLPFSLVCCVPLGGEAGALIPGAFDRKRVELVADERFLRRYAGVPVSCCLRYVEPLPGAPGCTQTASVNYRRAWCCRMKSQRQRRASLPCREKKRTLTLQAHLA